MSAYTIFAEFYDMLMADVDYEGWSDLVDAFIKPRKGRSAKVLELACGTGNLSLLLHQKGYVMTATDLSEDMLAIAGEKAQEEGARMRFLVQDMADINIRDQFDAVVTMCDGFNYLLEDSSLEATLTGIHRVLKPDGLVVIELSSHYKLSAVLGQNTIAEQDDEVSFIWENHYDPQTQILDFDISFYVKSDEHPALYEKHVEHHRQRAHEMKNLLAAFEKYFIIESVLDTDTGLAPTETSERWFFAGRKKMEASS